MKYLIIKVAPVMYMSGGRPFSDQEDEVSESLFWDMLFSLCPQAIERKQEISNYLIQGDNEFVQVGDTRFKIKT